MTRRQEIERELFRAREADRAGNSGRARTAARRAVGIAIEEVQLHHPGRFLGTTVPAQLASLALDRNTPRPVQEAADRLRARISSDFQSASIDPLGDASIIITFLLSLVEGVGYSQG